MTATDTEPVDAAAGRHFARHGPSRRWMTVFLALLAVAIVAAAALTYVGVKTVRSSRAGHVVSTVTDPEAPGFEAFLEPSPTLAVFHREDGKLRSIAVLALNSGDVGGSVLLLSPLTYASVDDQLTFNATMVLTGKSDGVLAGLQRALDFGITETVFIDDARLAEVVAPVAPLQVDNPTAVGPFPEGRITLAAADVGAYLAASNPGERPLLAVGRQRAFYRAWLDAIAASSDPVPGEVGSGISRFVRGVAGGPHRIEIVPVTETSVDGVTRTDIDRDAMAAIVPSIVPFPIAGAPGGRVRVRLLDGTGDPKHVQRAAPLVIPADAEIVLVGNADAFDYQETEIRFHHPGAEARAEAIQDALGTGRVVDDPRQTDAFDVTIVLGPDL